VFCTVGTPDLQHIKYTTKQDAFSIDVGPTTKRIDSIVAGDSAKASADCVEDNGTTDGGDTANGAVLCLTAYVIRSIHGQSVTALTPHYRHVGNIRLLANNLTRQQQPTKCDVTARPDLQHMGIAVEITMLYLVSSCFKCIYRLKPPYWIFTGDDLVFIRYHP